MQGHTFYERIIKSIIYYHKYVSQEIIDITLPKILYKLYNIMFSLSSEDYFIKYTTCFSYKIIKFLTSMAKGSLFKPK